MEEIVLQSLHWESTLLTPLFQASTCRTEKTHLCCNFEMHGRKRLDCLEEIDDRNMHVRDSSESSEESEESCRKSFHHPREYMCHCEQIIGTAAWCVNVKVACG